MRANSPTDCDTFGLLWETVTENLIAKNRSNPCSVAGRGHPRRSAEADGRGRWDRGLLHQRAEVRGEQLSLINRTMPFILAANLINGSLIVALFFDRIPLPVLIGWWLLMIVMVAVQLGIWLWCRSRSLTAQMNSGWRTSAVLGAAASGVLWGAAGVIFHVPGDLHLAVLGLVLGGMGAGSLVALAPCIWAFYAYLIPSILPFTVKLALVGTPDHSAMAAMCAIYVVCLMLLGWRAHSWLMRSLILGHERAHFAQTLQNASMSEPKSSRDQRKAEPRHRRTATAEATLTIYGYRQALVAEFGQRTLARTEPQPFVLGGGFSRRPRARRRGSSGSGAFV